LQKRLENENTLKDIKTLGYNFSTGLVFIYFEFAQNREFGLSPDAVLVIVNEDSRIAGIVDPFNPMQPNHLIPPLPEIIDKTNEQPISGEQPFALSIPSAAENIIFSEEEMYPIRVRSREFFKRLISGSQIGPMLMPPEDGGGHCPASGDTRCTYNTAHRTLIGYVCKRMTGLIAPNCDSWGPEYELDSSSFDYVTDDCGYEG
jgi:hypothetical protein